MKTMARLFLLVILFPTLACGQVTTPQAFVVPKISVSTNSIAPGQQFEVTVTAEIKPGIHLQAHQPSEDYLIPTSLTLDKSDDLTLGEVRYPDPIERKLSFSDKPVRVYEDQLPLKFSVMVAAGAAPGARELHGILRYQGCDDKQCYAPVKIEIKIPLVIKGTADGSQKSGVRIQETEDRSQKGEAGIQETTGGGRKVESPGAISWQPYRPDLLAEAKKAGKPVILDFYADWCGPCQEMEHSTFLDPHVIALSSRFLMLKVDLTHQEEFVAQQAVSTFDVKGVPTAIFYDQRGRENRRAEGYIGAGAYLRRMQAVLGAESGVEATGFQERLAGELASVWARHFWLVLVLCFVGGLALNLTPCVYPMIAITVSYFGGQTRRDAREAFGYAFAYFWGVVITYSLLGLVAAFTGSLFGALLQKPIVLIGIAVILVALALAMFGLYEFQPPQFLMQRASTLSSKAGYLGVFLLGAVMGIIAAPCVGPFLTGLLVIVGKEADLWRGFISFFALAVGLALPYLILGTYSSLLGKLPKSGNWMVWIKRVFGVVLLGMAVYFLLPLLKHG